VSCFSLDNNAFDITITNNGPSGYVGYSLDDGSTIIGSFLAFGASEVVSAPPDTVTVQLYSKLNSGDAWTGPLSTTTLDKSDTCEKDPIHLAFFCSGNSASPDGWNITNNNAFTLDVSWRTSTGSPTSSGTIEIPAGQTYTFSTAVISGVMQVYGNGSLLAQASAGSCTNPTPTTPTLSLSAFCAANPTAYDGWWVTNHGSSDVNFSWKIQGTSLSGKGTIPADSTIYFLTGIQSVTDVLQLFVNGALQASAPALTTCLKTPPILIPVTGADSNPLRHSLPYILITFALACTGLSLLAIGLRRNKNK
jgi:hypothetical protein